MKASKIGLVMALVAGVLLAGNSISSAQDGTKKGKDAPKREGGPGGGGGRGAEMMKERLDKLATELKLNEEQKKKVETVLKDQMETMRELRESTPEERQEKMKAARETMNKKMKEILTADQYAQFEKMPPPGRGPGGPGGPEGGKKRKGDGEKKQN